MISVDKAQELLDRAGEQILDALSLLTYLANEGHCTIGGLSDDILGYTIPRLEFWLRNPEMRGSIANLKVSLAGSRRAIPVELVNHETAVTKLIR